MTRDRRTRADATRRSDAGLRGDKRGDKRVAILKAAQRLIFCNGLDKTSMDAIAKCASVSKATVYAYFRSKEALFKMALDDIVRGMPSPRESWSGLGDSLHARLVAAAHDILNLSAGPAMNGLHCTLAASKWLPLHHTDMYWDICFGRYDKAIQELLKLEAARGALAISDFACASSQFFGLIAGGPTVRALLTGEPFVSGRPLPACVDSAVELFIRGYQPEGRRRSGQTENKKTRGTKK